LALVFTAMSRKQEQFNHLIYQQLGAIIWREIDDPDLCKLTITKVEVSKNSSFCRVWISVLGDEDMQERLLGLLSRKAHHFRDILMHTVELRRVPVLRFCYDHSAERVAEIEELLRGDKQI